MIRKAKVSWRESVNHKTNLVTFLGWSSLSSLFTRYKAPILTMGRPIAAQTPAINNKVMGLGSTK